MMEFAYCKLEIFVPETHLEGLRQALQAARGDVFRALDRRFVERYIDRIEVRREGEGEVTVTVTVYPKFGGKAAARIGKNEVRCEDIFLTM